ncbi:MAG: hypothetical protein GY730_05265 [bacterium]|nr:hypothetical protein [bacterium]
MRLVFQARKKLLNSKVLITGTGGPGSASTLYLTAAETGLLGIADSDQVEISNLQRQIIHSTANISKLKSLSAAEKILS